MKHTANRYDWLSLAITCVLIFLITSWCFKEELYSHSHLKSDHYYELISRNLIFDFEYNEFFSKMVSNHEFKSLKSVLENLPKDHPMAAKNSALIEKLKNDVALWLENISRQPPVAEDFGTIPTQ